MGMGECLRAAGMSEIRRAGLGLAELIRQPMLRQCWHGLRHPSPPVNLLRYLTPKRFCQNPPVLGPASELLSNVAACRGDTSRLLQDMGCPQGPAAGTRDP